MTTHDEMQKALTDTVDAYVAQEVSAQQAADQQVIDNLNAQVADLQAQLADCQSGGGETDAADQALVDAVADWVSTKKSLADNEATRQALLTWENAKGITDEPVETVDSLVIGARDSEVDWNTFEQKFGPVRCTRFFHNNLPAKQTRTYAGITVPDDVVLWVSFRDGTTDANLKSYLADMDPRTVLIFHHEPEGDYASGKAFTDKFDHYADIVHTTSPGTWLVHAASGYNYGGSRAGVDGSYIPDSADAYTIDSYQGRTSAADMEPLAQDDQFQKWLSLVQPKGKPLGITEYGRGTEPSTATTNSKRIELMRTDHEYLKSLGFVTWQLWWAAKTADDDWTFKDPNGQAAWRDIATEHAG